MMICRSKYEKHINKLPKQEKKLEALFNANVSRTRKRFPSWYLTYNFKYGRLHKKATILMVNRNYTLIHRAYNFEFDMRDRWKKSVKEAFKTVEEHIARCR